jgi:hypothetical protein
MLQRSLLLTLALGFSLTFAADDKNVIKLGKENQIGPVTSGMTLLGLKTVIGTNMIPAELDGPEGTKLEGLKVYPNTDREFHIILEQDGDEKYAIEAVIIGKAWTFENGLKVGMTMAEVEKINGKPFKMTGYGWDLGGYGLFEKGALEGKVTVRFDTQAENIPERLMGDVQISSNDKDLLATKPFVAAPISIDLRAER